MADKKISALSASTTPLAGTEVLPIVQSSTTRQVSVANLTAGRAISATSIQFGSGTVLSTYEEGTWTPADASGAGLSFSLIGTANYIKVGKIITVQALFTYPATVSGSNATIGGLPFAASSTSYAQASVFTNSGLTFNSYLGSTASSFDFRTNSNANISNANLSTKFVLITLIYQST